MKQIELGQALGIFANLGVIAGIIFLGVELQQNSELMRVQINQARADAALLNNEQSFNSDYIPTIRVKISDGQELTGEDWLRYVGWFRSSNRNQDNVLSQYRAGMLSDNIPRSVGDFVEAVVSSSTYARKAWDDTKIAYSDEYVAFVETILEETTDNELVEATSTAKAQVTAMPPNVQDFLSEIGSVWANDIQGNIQRTLEVYTPILRDAPKDGVRVTKNLLQNVINR